MIRPALLFLVALAPFTLCAQSATSVAGLQQDVASLRDEVAKLRGEIEDLRTAQDAANRAAATKAPATDTALTTRVGAIESTSAAINARKADRADLVALNAKIEKLATNVDKALAEQTRQVNAALNAGSAAKPAVTEAVKPAAATAPAPAVATTPATTPSDMPKTGVRYTVQHGDSVPRIAKKMNSKSAWILAANGMKSNAELKADAVIFVPQTDKAE